MPNFRPELFCGHAELQTGLRYAADVQKQNFSTAAEPYQSDLHYMKCVQQQQNLSHHSDVCDMQQMCQNAAAEANIYKMAHLV